MSEKGMIKTGREKIAETTIFIAQHRHKRRQQIAIVNPQHCAHQLSAVVNRSAVHTAHYLTTDEGWIVSALRLYEPCTGWATESDQISGRRRNRRVSDDAVDAHPDCSHSGFQSVVQVRAHLVRVDPGNVGNVSQHIPEIPSQHSLV